MVEQVVYSLGCVTPDGSFLSVLTLDSVSESQLQIEQLAITMLDFSLLMIRVVSWKYKYNSSSDFYLLNLLIDASKSS